MDALLLLRGAYLGAAILVLLVAATPALRTRFLSYGARSDDTDTTRRTTSTAQNSSSPSATRLVTTLLDVLASIRVPHGWFASFYALSVAASLYWAVELISKGPAFTAIARSQLPLQRHSSASASMTVGQVQVAWLMMFLQGTRRLYECLCWSKPSAASMWIGHWALGMLFYLCTSVSIWIEGTAALHDHVFAMQDFTLRAPSLRIFLGVLAYILAAGLQHDCHAYLASLKASRNRRDGSAPSTDYSLPEHPAWNLSLSPHYFAECLIYLAIAIVAAPAHSVCNGTLLCALAFVAINLGVTADGTKKWYARKFGEEHTRSRSRMIPFIF